MIGRLTGIILDKQPPYLLIDVRGVGYEVQAPMTSFYPLPEIGGEVMLYTHFSVSETAQQLFAFYTKQERQLFRTLIKVNGIGPKMALAILSGMTVTNFISCVLQGNTAALAKVPGIGKKTAERLIIEVKDRLGEIDRQSAGHDTPINALGQITNAHNIAADAESALIALGYRPTAAAEMIASATRSTVANNPVKNSEELIKLALRSLSSGS
jgi:holliday junction DNA helicase RuvA